MIVYTKIDNYNNNFIYLCESINNTIIDNGKFIRVNYSDNNSLINALYILVPLSNFKNIHTNYYSIEDDLLCQKLCNIEFSILKKYSCSKQIKFKLKEQLNQRHIKIFNYKHESDIILIKISGIWEDKDKYGLTYKFIHSEPTI
jgi:hypothetical protein